jgi:hypothetical protein
MKELTPIIDREGDKIELEAPKPIEKQQVYKGTMRIHPGMKAWEYDYLTQVISEAEYEQQTIEYNGEQLLHYTRKILIKKNCAYTVAINKKNAHRKIEKMMGVKLKVKNL